MNHTTIWAGVSVLLTVLIAGVVLSYTGMETGAIIALLGGLLALGGVGLANLDKLTNVQRVNVEQDRKLDVIEERTNGGLQREIRANMEAALNERFGPPPTVE